MTNKVEAQAASGSPENYEKRYPDPNGLYRTWLASLGDAPDGEGGDTVNSAEIEELWRRWFGTATGLRDRTAENGDGFGEGMAPLWAGMAEELRDEVLSEDGTLEDPVKAFVRWYNANGERWSEVADELLKKDEVLEPLGRFFEAYARSYKGFRRVSEEGLEKLRVPTRSDVARVARLVLVVENKVDRIEEAFEEFIHGDAEPATAGSLSEAVVGLEERMDRLEGKMDRILGALEQLGAAGTAEGEEKRGEG